MTSCCPAFSGCCHTVRFFRHRVAWNLGRRVNGPGGWISEDGRSAYSPFFKWSREGRGYVGITGLETVFVFRLSFMIRCRCHMILSAQ